MRSAKDLFSRIVSSLLALSLVLPAAPVASVAQASPATYDASYPEDRDYWVDLGDGTLEGAHWYVYRNGSLRRSCWVEYRGAWYYLKADGEMATGKFLNPDDSTWYYLNPYHDGSFGKMSTGWLSFEGSTYYLWPVAGSGYQGRMMVGWQTINGASYFFADEPGDDYGKMATGTREIAGRRYRFAQDGRLLEDLGAVAPQIPSVPVTREDPAPVETPETPEAPETPLSPEAPESPEAPATPEAPAISPNSITRLSTPTTWTQEAAPDYYRVVGQASVKAVPSAGTAVYDGLDAKGRTGSVTALITKQMADEGATRPRDSLNAYSPSGWGHNAQVSIKLPNGKTYNGYFWNRSHLLAKALGGADATKNLVTGTRMQNVGSNSAAGYGGMAYTENLARTWLATHENGTLYYAATPLYRGNELVPRSVVVDVLSSDGMIDLEVEVFNAAYGFTINYATGEFASSESSAPVTPPSPESPKTPAAPVEAEKVTGMVYVTKSGKKYHSKDSCRGLNNADRSKMRHITREQAIAEGKTPCSICW